MDNKAYRAGFQAGLNGGPRDTMFGDKAAQAEYDQGYYDGKAEYEQWLSRQ
jgi:hypothetical protein